MSDRGFSLGSWFQSLEHLQEFYTELSRNPELLADIPIGLREDLLKVDSSGFLSGLSVNPSALQWVPFSYRQELLRIDPSGFLSGLRRDPHAIFWLPLEDRVAFLLEHKVDVEGNSELLGYIELKDWLRLVSRRFLLGHIDDKFLGGCREALL